MPQIAMGKAGAQILQIMRSAYATSTWKGREGILRRYNIFLRQQRAQHSESMLIRWLHSTKTSNRTQLQYASGLSAVLSSTPLKLYMRGLRKTAGVSLQAAPLTRAYVDVLVRAADTMELKVQLWLTWKTASRWDDVLQLSQYNVLEASATEIIIHFYDNTKTSSMAGSEAGAQLWVVIKPSPADAALWPQMVQFLSQQRFVLNAMDTSRIEAWLNTGVVGKPLPRPGTRDHYTAHSFKVGALDMLTEKLAEIATPETRAYLLSALGLLAKHRSAVHPLPASTAGYTRKQIGMARLLGTGDLTKFL
jgi:hypothetical protein